MKKYERTTHEFRTLPGLNLQENSLSANLTDKISKISTNSAFCQLHFNMETVTFCPPFWQTHFENCRSFQIFVRFGGKTDIKVEDRTTMVDCEYEMRLPHRVSKHKLPNYDRRKQRSNGQATSYNHGFCEYEDPLHRKASKQTNTRTSWFVFGHEITSSMY